MTSAHGVDSKTTLIRQAAWVAAWDASRHAHTYRRDIDVVFHGDTVTFVGPSYGGAADVTVDGSHVQRRMLEAVPTSDYAGRPADQIAPLSLPLE